MQMRTIKNAKTSACAVLITLIAMIFQVMCVTETAHAARPNENVPELTQSKSSFTLQVNYADGEETTPVDGVKLTVYKIAGVKVSNGTAKYPVENAFNDCGFKFTEMTADDAQDYADKAEEVVKKNGMSGKTVTTGSNGKASFGELENGIYLVRQTGKTGSAKNYGTFASWLVEIPELCETESGSKYWNYQVTSYPKPFVGRTEGETPDHDTEEDEPEKPIEGEEEEDEESFDGDEEEKEDKFNKENKEEEEEEKENPFEKLVKTGDRNSLAMFGGMLFVAIAGLIVVLITKKKRQ